MKSNFIFCWFVIVSGLHQAYHKTAIECVMVMNHLYLVNNITISYTFYHSHQNVLVFAVPRNIVCSVLVNVKRNDCVLFDVIKYYKILNKNVFVLFGLLINHIS